MLYIELNGTRLTGRVDGLDSFSITKERSQDHLKETTTFSGELKFYDDGYAILFPLMVASPTGVTKTVNVSIYDDCCNQKFDGFVISGDMVDYCTGDCFISTRLRLVDRDQQIRDLFNTTNIADNRNGFFNTTPFPKIMYCNELRPDWLHVLVLIFASLFQMIVDLIVYTFFVILEIIIDALFLICEAMNSIIFSFDLLYYFIVAVANTLIKIIKVLTLGIVHPKIIKKPIIKWDVLGCKKLIAFKRKWQKELLDMISGMSDLLVGCNNCHPSPLIRDYVQNAMTICGVSSFVSSVFNNPADERYNTVYYYSPSKRGRPVANVPNYISQNAPQMTVSSFLDQICESTYSEWWIDGGVLHLERKDSWLSATVLYDAVQNASTGNILEGVCFKYNEGKQYNRLEIEYTTDPIDICGNEELEKYQLRDQNGTIGLNFGKIYGYNAAWKDNKKIYIPFAPVKFRSRDIAGDAWAYAMLAFPTVALFFGSKINKSLDFIMQQQNQVSVPKLLIWDGKNINRGVVKDYGTGKDRNYPYQLRPSNTNPPVPNGSGYDPFLILDPMANPYRFWNYSLKVKADCIQINDLNINKTCRIMMPWGAIRNARINSLTLSYGTNDGTTLEIQGEV